MSALDDPPVPPPPKTEDVDEESFSDSSQDFDGLDQYNGAQETAQVQKRKGGRKPIYATSEERKQRNRQAQAAFRERRTEYIKQLETTIKQHEDSLQSLQQNHRHAADECLMLRYKNSLLERILLEKGIDVQAELRSKTDPQHVTPHIPPSINHQPSPMQRGVNGRHPRTRRAGSAGGARGPKSQSSQTSIMSDGSTRTHPTPPLTTSSPVKAKSSMSSLQSGFSGGMYPSSHQPPPPPMKSNRSQAAAGLHSPNMSNHMTGSTRKSNGTKRNGEIGTAAGSLPGYYAPTFRSHIEQLGMWPPALTFGNLHPHLKRRPSGTDFLVVEQEYDASADMLDEAPSDQSAGPGPYPDSFYPQSVSMQGQSPLQTMHGMQPPGTSHSMDAPGMGMNNMGRQMDPYNPMLDADPFGLDSTMHFPTQFTS